MTKRRKLKVNYFSIFLIVIMISIFLILLYGGREGWFKFIINVPTQNQSLSIVQTPTQQQPIRSSCYQVCSDNGFSKSYDFNGACKPGESIITYGYPNQAPLLKCCCYNEDPIPPSNCIDSDNGQDRNTPGHVTVSGESIYDQCSEDNKAVYEYFCQDGRLAGNIINCLSGESCSQTRSGGHCVLASSGGWNPGDTVFSGSGSGSISGGSLPATGNLDLSDYGFIPGGTCTLGIEMVTDWSYANDACWGIQSQEGLKWDFYDSNGLEYSRTDLAPAYRTFDLHPPEHTLEWDGVTDWKEMVSKTLNLPGCNINYQYEIRIYIYSC